MGMSPRTFQELLSDVAAAHRREVEALRAELEGLRVDTAQPEAAVVAACVQADAEPLPDEEVSEEDSAKGEFAACCALDLADKSVSGPRPSRETPFTDCSEGEGDTNGGSIEIGVADPGEVMFAGPLQTGAALALAEAVQAAEKADDRPPLQHHGPLVLSPGCVKTGTADVQLVGTAAAEADVQGLDDASVKPPWTLPEKLMIPLPGPNARGDIPGSVESGMADVRLPPVAPCGKPPLLQMESVDSECVDRPRPGCGSPMKKGERRGRKSHTSVRQSSKDDSEEESVATAKTIGGHEHAAADEAHASVGGPRRASLQLPCDSERHPRARPSIGNCSSRSNCSLGSRASWRMLDRRDRVSSLLGDDGKPIFSQTGTLELSMVWGELGEAAQDAALYRHSATPGSAVSMSKPQISHPHKGGDDSRHRCAQRLVAAPSSRTRLAWDLAGVVFLAYDLIMVPLQVYAVGESDMIRSLNLATTCFWTLDILSSFFVGYHSKGVVVMDPILIALRYLKSWFLLDLTIVVMDWVFQVGLNSVEYASTFGRASRGMRAMRLLRVAKLHNLLSEVNIKAKIRSELTRTLLGILKIIIVILILNHFVACGFYGLHYVMDERTWVDKNFASDDSFAYRYFTSLHWSMTQFTPASMEVMPVNAVERCFAVCTLLLAMICFSSFVSSITNAMTRYGNSNLRQQQQTLALYRFLGQRSISTQLVNRVWHYLHDRQVMHSQARARESDVELFALLPDSLKVDLRYEMYMPAVSGHPLFQRYGHLEPQAIRHICKSALQEHTLSIREELFGDCVDVTHMIFVVDGLLTYSYPMMEDNGVEISMQGQVTKGQWACEAALWVARLPLVGPFVAAVSCELLLLSVAEFVVIVRRFPSSVGFMAQYADTFVEFAKQESQGCKWKSCFCNSPEVVEDLAHKASEQHVQLAMNNTNLSEWVLRESSSKDMRCLTREPSGNSIKDSKGFFTKWMQRPGRRDSASVVPVSA